MIEVHYHPDNVDVVYSIRNALEDEHHKEVQLYPSDTHPLEEVSIVIEDIMYSERI